jgi:hypothetical protein
VCAAHAGRGAREEILGFGGGGGGGGGGVGWGGGGGSGGGGEGGGWGGDEENRRKLVAAGMHFRPQTAPLRRRGSGADARDAASGGRY